MGVRGIIIERVRGFPLKFLLLFFFAWLTYPKTGVAKAHVLHFCLGEIDLCVHLCLKDKSEKDG